MSSPMQSLGDSPMNFQTPGNERDGSGFAAVAAAAAAAAANACGNVNNSNNCKTSSSTQQQQQGTSTTYCQRRNKSALGKHRHQPYDRSPGGGSTCSTSSDESGNEDTETDQPKSDQHQRKRTAANERERRRMHTVNSAFDQLRELVPTYPSSRKLSKIDTLKLACTYIQDLKTLLINSHIMPHGEDVVYHPDGYATTNPSPVYTGGHVKAEAQYAASQDYPASACTYPPFSRVQQPYISDPDFSASEPENHSPPYYAPSSQAASAAVIAVRPLSLSRTSSDSAVSVHMQTAQQVSISMSSQPLPQSVPPYPRHAPSSCPSLATVQHTSLPVAPTITSPVQGHASLPWQRTGSVPYPCVYSQ